ncbi:hypothetical protein WISP_61687 [Willisornis vidua]|uniref:Uncharacterized protein n=1 Tax=Willisornis vidua TaxID=1566151 RepID=A0ABQ9DGE9_9PASS|nr:hypothetical protein WISP_61687 [Willisornis vidua]
MFLFSLFLHFMFLFGTVFSPLFDHSQEVYGVLELENVLVPLLQALGFQSTGTKDSDKRQLNATLTPDHIKSRELRRVSPSYYLDGRPPGNTEGCSVGSSPEDFTVTVQARLAMADEPLELKGGASSAHAVPHLKNPLCRLEGHTHVGRALPKFSFTKPSHDDDESDKPCMPVLDKNQGVTRIEAMLMRTQLLWAGHVSRMEDHRLLKIVLYGELATGCCKRGAPKRRCKDSLKQHLSLGHIDCHQWSTLASNWDSWRHTIHEAAASFENARRVSLEEKRQCRKNCSSPVLPKEMFHCAFCDHT